MAASGIGASIAASLEGLRTAVHALRTELQLPSVPVETCLRNLASVVSGLERTKRARPVKVVKEYVDQWNEFLSGQRPTLESRTIRALCWNPAVATDRSFQHFLTRTQYVPNSQSLQGMISSCHARWSRELAVSEAVERIRDRLNQYSGRNRLLTKWKEAASMIIGPKAHDFMAAELAKSEDGLAGFCDSWGLAIESSQLFHDAAEVCAAHCLQQLDQVPSFRKFLFKELIPWPGWAPAMFKSVMNRVIQFPNREDTELIEEVTRLVLADQRLGDPRHPQNQNNWIGMDDASKRVQEWLSAADITFFFESVLPRGQDPHGRKTFWLRYVGSRGLRSRPLLSSTDRFRLREILHKKGANAANFGRLLDEDTSAFILDFGPLVAIEFSKVGNACFLYEKKAAAEIVPDLWTSTPFSKSNLKRPSKIVKDGRIVHDKQNRWKRELERILAQYGIRPVS